MDINAVISLAKAHHASDVHIEEGLPITLRVNGQLVQTSESIAAGTLLDAAKRLIGSRSWPEFIERGSWDLSRIIAKTRCRINIFKTARGLGMAIRILMSTPISIKNLNLHPDLMPIVDKPHGLVLFSGATGSGKSTSMAALIEEINTRHAKHILTIEQPIEYFFKPKKALVRQREVGRDTPSFRQALKDALREDPDVIVVGEMRDTETMHLTLNAAETGHLVFATLHSATVPEALARLVAAFAAEEQESVRLQLADTLVAAVCQRISYWPDLGLRLPECEILYSNEATRAVLRSGQLAKLKDILLTNANDHMWTFERYQRWIRQHDHWVRFEAFRDYEPDELSPVPSLAASAPVISTRRATSPSSSPQDLVIDEEDDDLGSILDELR